MRPVTLPHVPISTTAAEPAAPTLARRMGLFTLVAYGVGDMVGSGIYGTIGVAAERMGNAVWMAFAGSMLAALFTGLSYASLASRYPRAAGAAFITQRAYRIAFLSYVVGLAVVASGLTSMATNSNVFSDNLAAALHDVRFLSGLRPWMILLVFIGVMTIINLRGIRESMWANVLCTAIEVGGLIFVIVVGVRYWGSVDYLATPPTEPGAVTGGLDPMLIGSGAVLTFFAFIGFEDMLNVSEEVKRPRRTMPLGIVIALVVTAILYMLISITAVSVVPYHQLGDVERGVPLQQITDRAAPWLPSWVFMVITLFAVSNTVLLNYVMGSRMLYGMSRQGLTPKPLGAVHHSRRTPHIAILTLMVMIVLLAFIGNIAQLASATSLLMLMVFCVVNAALVVLRVRRPDEQRGGFEVPIIIPIFGALTCGGLVLIRLVHVFSKPDGWQAPVIAGCLLAFISVLYLVMRPRVIEEELEIYPAEAES